MASSDDYRRKVLDLLRQTEPVDPSEKATAKPKAPRGAKPSVSITGNGNIVGNGNVVAGGSVNLNPVIRPKVHVTTGEGTIDAAQKAELTRLIGEWVTARNAVRKGEASFPAAWKALNNAFSLNSYHELPMEKFGEARAWLQRQLAIISSMKSAPKKLPDWRRNTIGAIKVRCKNQLGEPDAYKTYILKRFGKSSLALLTDDELQATRQYVFGKG